MTENNETNREQMTSGRKRIKLLEERLETLNGRREERINIKRTLLLVGIGFFFLSLLFLLRVPFNLYDLGRAPIESGKRVREEIQKRGSSITPQPESEAGDTKAVINKGGGEQGPEEGSEETRPGKSDAQSEAGGTRTSNNKGDAGQGPEEGSEETRPEKSDAQPEAGRGHIKGFLFCLIVGFFFVVIALFKYTTRDIDTEIQDINNELDLLNIEVASREERAEKLFKLHQFELKRYYDQTLSHSAWVFFAGLACILIGFAIIGGTIGLVVWAPEAATKALPELIEKVGPALKEAGLPEAAVEKTTEVLEKHAELGEKGFLPEQIVIAALGAIGGILANFISVIYLKMFSETMKSLTGFHNRLVRTHHLHFGNFLIAKIKDEGLREAALADIAKALARVPVFEDAELSKEEPA